ncbi:DUF1801 domain-containing protein [Frigoriflavimonas asaccharolytica]|uniref:YdhG-like domain-containing protein n=1 Tax=Frigoriflavimonas asaccharolytica TaxID=2735899 RepID=A0A8J8K7F6_9FLAO|nr:DUF1801 domain-containing protein [Frigoriflavimonas asaccharolytica]NRS91953.1 hypothetical protein [Frigoriflavimonas asaccharolytica]
MTIETPQNYLDNVDEERSFVFKKLYDTINTNIPEGFEAQISYGMIGWVVPFSIYPDGYHCSPELPLPFLSIAAQKNFFAIYHMGIYADPSLLNWFVEEYPKHSKRKLDMGKSCIRFKKIEEIPFELIAELCQKMTVEHWISLYDKNFKK